MNDTVNLTVANIINSIAIHAMTSGKCYDFVTELIEVAFPQFYLLDRADKCAVYLAAVEDQRIVDRIHSATVEA
jgi:hypothetical protein